MRWWKSCLKRSRELFSVFVLLSSCATSPDAPPDTPPEQSPPAPPPGTIEAPVVAESPATTTIEPTEDSNTEDSPSPPLEKEQAPSSPLQPPLKELPPEAAPTEPIQLNEQPPPELILLPEELPQPVISLTSEETPKPPVIEIIMLKSQEEESPIVSVQLPELPPSIPETSKAQAGESALHPIEELSIGRTPALEPVPEVEPETSIPETSGWITWETTDSMFFPPSKIESRKIALPAAGWIVLNKEEGYSLSERTQSAEETAFFFLFPTPGTYTLTFQRQDLQERELHRRVVTVLIEDSNQTEAVGSPVEAEPQIEELLDGIEVIQENELATEIELPHWQDYIEYANKGSFEIFQEPAWFSLVQDSAIDSPVQLELTEILLEKGEWQLAKPLIDRIATIRNTRQLSDRELILLARYHDVGTPNRNEKSAFDYYTALTANYPLSKYWDEADRRSRYLKRFYLLIR